MYPHETHYFCDYRWLLNTYVRKLFHKEIVVGRKLEQVVGMGGIWDESCDLKWGDREDGQGRSGKVALEKDEQIW